MTQAIAESTKDVVCKLPLTRPGPDGHFGFAVNEVLNVGMVVIKLREQRAKFSSFKERSRERNESLIRVVTFQQLLETGTVDKHSIRSALMDHYMSDNGYENFIQSLLSEIQTSLTPMPA